MRSRRLWRSSEWRRVHDLVMDGKIVVMILRGWYLETPGSDFPLAIQSTIRSISEKASELGGLRRDPERRIFLYKPAMFSGSLVSFPRG